MTAAVALSEEQLGLFAAPKPTPGRVERDWGGEYTIDDSIRCVSCGRTTKVRVSVSDGDRSADPRGVCGTRARVTLEPEQYGYDTGSKAYACWDCLCENGSDGERRTLDKAARAGGWRKGPVAIVHPVPTDLPRTRLGDDVLRVLSACEVDGDHVRLPGARLDRKLYTRVNEALEALGGRWNRKANAHVFSESPADALDAAISTGCVVRAKDLGWYPTPEPLAREIVKRAELRTGMMVLEPSAGEGAIARAARDTGATVRCFELDHGRTETLRRDGFNVVQGDFLSMPIARVYDAAVMNPPFGKRADVAHVRHALSFVRPGGRVVAIMSAGVMFREDSLATSFRALVNDSGGTIEALPDGSFLESGTGVRTCVVEVRAA